MGFRGGDEGLVAEVVGEGEGLDELLKTAELVLVAEAVDGLEIRGYGG